MPITRLNYEEYFLLYVDNELPAVDRAAVELFIQENPDLREELILLQQTVLKANKRLLFDDKASLLKYTSSVNPVNETNYEEYFLLYGDNELNNEQKDQVEQFVYKNPQHQVSFELLEKVRFVPDHTITFPDKQSLYRTEKEKPIVVMRWWRMAAAAVVLLFVGAAGWYYSTYNGGSKKNIDPVIAKSTDTPAGKTPVIAVPEQKNNFVQNNAPENKATNAITIPLRKIIDGSKKATNRNPIQDQPLIAVVTPAEKKSVTESNIPKEAIVPPKETDVAVGTIDESKKTGNNTGEVEVSPRRIVDEEVSFEKMSKNDAPPAATYASNTNDRIEVLNTSVSNKNKMRGFFRKVSRVVTKATSFGNGENSDDKKGLRIANFEIALK